MKAILACQGWPAPVRNPQSRATSTMDAPLLVIGSRYDNATPASWSRQVKAHLSDKASLVIVDGWTHAMKATRPGCEADIIANYLHQLRTPSTRCASKPPLSS